MDTAMMTHWPLLSTAEILILPTFFGPLSSLGLPHVYFCLVQCSSTRFWLLFSWPNSSVHHHSSIDDKHSWPVNVIRLAKVLRPHPTISHAIVISYHGFEANGIRREMITKFRRKDWHWMEGWVFRLCWPLMRCPVWFYQCTFESSKAHLTLQYVITRMSYL